MTPFARSHDSDWHMPVLLRRPYDNGTENDYGDDYDGRTRNRPRKEQPESRPPAVIRRLTRVPRLAQIAEGTCPRAANLPIQGGHLTGGQTSWPQEQPPASPLLEDRAQPRNAVPPYRPIALSAQCGTSPPREQQTPQIPAPSSKWTAEWILPRQSPATVHCEGIGLSDHRLRVRIFP